MDPVSVRGAFGCGVVFPAYFDLRTIGPNRKPRVKHRTPHTVRLLMESVWQSSGNSGFYPGISVDVATVDLARHCGAGPRLSSGRAA